ncbi:MAG: hypothetical protein E6J87_20260 [Deltaproteobacteria bacterium]|nr:MAG: hypothetical protein E6J87_20260 [Deltaproteobacteria bacterium]
MRNPIATEDQRVTELRALELAAHPQLVQTRAQVREWWLRAVDPSPDMRACFEWAFEEVMFAAVVWSLNQDPLHPRVVTITRLAHRLDGRDVPGSRWGLDNPDSIYRVIPISGSERYEIRGRVPERRLTENYFTLWDANMNTIDVLDGRRLVVDAERRFAISVDSEPANGRPNHVRSSPAAHEFYIRDVMLDWERDRANEIEIVRLGAPPPRPPFTEEQQLERAAAYMWKWVKSSERWNAQSADRPVNKLEFVIDRQTDGALRNQVYILGRFQLSDDEALIVNVGLGGAEYFVCPVTNLWGTTNDVVGRTGSLNKAQSLPNRDGSYTYVVSAVDPGVHNWIDTSGTHEGILTLRWAEFPGGRPGPDLRADSRLVRRGQLRAQLPPETRFVTRDERTRQLARRATSYAWRLLES